MSRHRSRHIKDCERSFKSIEGLLNSHRKFINNQRKKLRENEHVLQKLPALEDRYRSVQSCEHENTNENRRYKKQSYASEDSLEECNQFKVGDECCSTESHFSREGKYTCACGADIYLRGTNKVQDKINHKRNAFKYKDMYGQCHEKVLQRDVGSWDANLQQNYDNFSNYKNMPREVKEYETDRAKEYYDEYDTSSQPGACSLATNVRNNSSRNSYHATERRSTESKKKNTMSKRNYPHRSSNDCYIKIPRTRSITPDKFIPAERPVKRNEDIREGANMSGFRKQAHNSKDTGWRKFDEGGYSDSMRTISRKESDGSSQTVKKELAFKNDPQILEIAKLIVDYFQKDPTPSSERPSRKHSRKFHDRETTEPCHVSCDPKDHKVLPVNESSKYNHRNSYKSKIKSKFTDSEQTGLPHKYPLRNTSNLNVRCMITEQESKSRCTRRYQSEEYSCDYLNSKQKSSRSLAENRKNTKLREVSVRLENQLPLYDENAHLLGYLKEGTQIIGPSCPQSCDESLFEEVSNGTQCTGCKFSICNRANKLKGVGGAKPCVRWTNGSDFTTSVQHELLKAKFDRCPNCERCN